MSRSRRSRLSRAVRLTLGLMNKENLATKLARGTSLSQSQAADELDRVVHGILKKLRSGKTVTLPGLGRLKPGPCGYLTFEPARRAGRK